MSCAEGIVLSATPGIEGCWSKPKRLAVATRSAQHRLTPSGAKTELHDTAKAFTSVPPHASPLAFCMVKPLIVVWVWIGKVVLGLTIPACSAPVVVMIFIVEPGGCTEEKAIPASA